jgi:hypothetical protein
MSLLLSQVGAPPVVSVTNAITVRPVTPTDAGTIEIRGLIRTGLVVAAAAVVAFVPQITRPAQLDQGEQLRACISTGYVVTVAAPTVTPATRIAPVQLADPETTPGHISTGYVVAVAAATPTPAIRIIPATLTPSEPLSGRISTGFSIAVGYSVAAVIPPVTPIFNGGGIVYEIRKRPLDDDDIAIILTLIG